MKTNANETSLPDVFAIGEAKYRVDEFGVIHQQPPYAMPAYDLEYVNDRYGAMNHIVADLSFLRAGFVQGVCDGVQRVLDVGYGSGGFLRAMQLSGAYCAGTDISGYPVPKGCHFFTWAQAVAEKEWDVVTFFDSLEHFPDLEVSLELRARYLVISAPCVRPGVTVAWLKEWKHLRPGEHLHHFSVASMTRWLAARGYHVRAVRYLEDALRPPGADPNIFTGVFERNFTFTKEAP